MDTSELQERFEYLVKEIMLICKIADRNDYDIDFVEPFISDLSAFLDELKEHAGNV